MIDQLVRLFGVVNSFRVQEFTGKINPTSGARLNLDTQLKAFHITAADGSDPGITISFKGMGIHNLSLPTKDQPQLALDPYITNLRLDLDERFFARAADFARDPLLASMHQVVNRIELGHMQLRIRMDASKVVNFDVDIDTITLQQNDEVLLRLEDLSLSVLDYDSKKPPAVAQKEASVVLRTLSVQVLEGLFSRTLAAVRKKIPREFEKLSIGLPGPLMVVDATIKKLVSVSFRVDLRLETESDLFGIFFDRFYVPGTKMGVPSAFRNIFLSLVRTFFEKRLKGLVEISNESLRINPWGKVPFELYKKVKTFTVGQGFILLVFEPPSSAPRRAEEHALGLTRGANGTCASVLPPGPAFL